MVPFAVISKEKHHWHSHRGSQSHLLAVVIPMGISRSQLSCKPPKKITLEIRQNFQWKSGLNSLHLGKTEPQTYFFVRWSPWLGLLAVKAAISHPGCHKNPYTSCWSIINNILPVLLSMHTLQLLPKYGAASILHGSVTRNKLKSKLKYKSW